jgi:membrane dipeptidase
VRILVQVFDGHCDVLYKMWDKKNKNLFFKSTDELHSSLERLKEGGVKVQTMAVFVPPETPKELKHYAALEMIDILYHNILSKTNDIKLIKDAKDLQQLNAKNDNNLYILLSIEGADPFYGDLTYLRTFYQLGVRSVGFTWNFRNEAADGVRERNPAGLSNFGFELLAEMNHLKMAVDISHIAERGFWDCIEHSKQPIMASHCNARKLCEHPRNLYDEQIEAIFKSKGLVGLTLVPSFLSKESKVTPHHVLLHLDHMLSLGGKEFIGLGTDFDGIDETVEGLEHSGKLEDFINLCQKYYSEEVIKNIFFENWRNYYVRLWKE